MSPVEHYEKLKGDLPGRDCREGKGMNWMRSESSLAHGAAFPEGLQAALVSQSSPVGVI